MSYAVRSSLVEMQANDLSPYEWHAREEFGGFDEMYLCMEKLN